MPSHTHDWIIVAVHDILLHPTQGVWMKSSGQCSATDDHCTTPHRSSASLKLVSPRTLTLTDNMTQTAASPRHPPTLLCPKGKRSRSSALPPSWISSKVPDLSPSAHHLSWESRASITLVSHHHYLRPSHHPQPRSCKATIFLIVSFILPLAVDCTKSFSPRRETFGDNHGLRYMQLCFRDKILPPGVT